MSIFLRTGLVLAMFNLLNVSSFANGLGSHSTKSESSNWELECLEQIKIKAELPSSIWVWHMVEVKTDNQARASISKFSALVSGVVLSSKSEAIVGKCDFLAGKPKQTIGKFLSASLVRRTEIKSPWQDLASMQFFEVQNELASDLDAFFSDTVDEGNIDADVAKDTLGNSKVSCSPRLTKKNKGIILFCSFDIVAKVVEDEGDSEDENSEDEKYNATCAIRWGLSDKVNVYGTQYLINDEDDFTRCAENVSDGG